MLGLFYAAVKKTQKNRDLEGYIVITNALYFSVVVNCGLQMDSSAGMI